MVNRYIVKFLGHSRTDMGYFQRRLVEHTIRIEALLWPDERYIRTEAVDAGYRVVALRSVTAEGV